MCVLAAASTVSGWGFDGLFLGQRIRVESRTPMARRSIGCRAEVGRSSAGKVSKNAVGNHASPLNSSSEDGRDDMAASNLVRSSEDDVEKPESVQEEKGPKNPLEKILMQRLSLDKAMDEIVGFMAPREKGDIRDVILMSLSFAVFVYISQRLVCAYCVLRHAMHSNF